MNPKTKIPAVRLERIIHATPHEIYRAWLEPETLCRWMVPGRLEVWRVERVEVEEREGGHYRIWQTNSGAHAGGFDCEILELVPDERIVFRWGFVGAERTREPKYDSLLTISLREAPGGGTSLTLVHERLEELSAAMPYITDNVERGWESALEKLAVMFGTPRQGS